jgi:hypothetical protein
MSRDAMRPQLVLIHLRREDHFRCVNDALAAYPVRIHILPSAWELHVTIRSGSLGDVMAALHDCLVENEIPLVRVTVDGRTYAMEPISA